MSRGFESRRQLQKHELQRHIDTAKSENEIRSLIQSFRTLFFIVAAFAALTILIWMLELLIAFALVSLVLLLCAVIIGAIQIIIGMINTGIDRSREGPNIEFRDPVQDEQLF